MYPVQISRSMAKRKMTPAQKKFLLQESAASVSNYRLIQVSDILSKANRRLYRQGRNYRVKLSLVDDVQQGAVSVYHLADTWIVKLAWQKAFEAYMNATREEREMLGGRVARWNDFRVLAGVSAIPGGVPDMDPVVFNHLGTSARLASGEFNNSTVELDSGDKEFSWGPGDSNTFGMLEELEKLFNTDQSPVTVEVNAPYNNIDGDQMNLDQFVELQEEGNEPPYDADDWTTPWHRVDVIRSDAANGGKLETDWFNAPCGFILIQTSNANKDVELTVASGDYKGVLGHSMGTAKLTPEKKYKVR